MRLLSSTKKSTGSWSACVYRSMSFGRTINKRIKGSVPVAIVLLTCLALHASNALAVEIWISTYEILRLPTSGKAWESVKYAANHIPAAEGGHNSKHDTSTLACALVAVRLNDPVYYKRTADNLIAAIGTELNCEPEDSCNSLSISRNLASYVVAADIIDFKNYDPGREPQFRAWVDKLRTWKHPEDGWSITQKHERRPNNHGTMAGASRIAADVYLGDMNDLARAAQVFKGWLGDRVSYAGFKYGDLSWQADPSRPVGINPMGSTKEGHSIDGVLPDDQRRGGTFTWPPAKENYVYEALQGALVQAAILHRAGYDAFNWQDKALLRAFEWLHNEAKFPAEGDDTWQPHVINYIYGTRFPAPIPSKPGKVMGWTDWTHSR